MLNKRNKVSSVPLKKPLVNHIALVVDTSGSMDIIRVAANKMVRDVVSGFSPVPFGQTSKISYYTFNNSVQIHQQEISLNILHTNDIFPGGNTSLIDAIGTAIENFQHLVLSSWEDHAFMIIVITDGEENWSRIYTPQEIANEIKDTQLAGNWTYVIHCPKGYASNLSKNFQIPSDNIREWDGTAQGAYEVAYSNSVGTQGYYGSRSKGLSATRNFFVNTDLSKVSPKDIKSKLDDVSSKFEIYDVPKEQDISSFVTSKTKKQYKIGQGYYLLTKPELIQANKNVVIMEKGSKAVWGGSQARALIGLPDNADAKVTPKNHMAYNIFIESRASNRKLVRGTQLLVDKTKFVDSKPTWEDPAKLEEFRKAQLIS